jgi:UDP-N-acetylmuramoyl-tripeptide--D-alanyl-D-alanine ligase
VEPLSGSDVLAALAVSQQGALPAAFAGVSTDTRSLRGGELFVALRGDRFDGHAFLAAAAAAGAAAAVVDCEIANPPLPLIRVQDSGKALLALARFHRRRLRAKVIAVTGSNGKTTTKDLIAHVLATRHRVVKSPSSFNNFVGVPLTLFAASQDTDFVVAEIGTNAPGEIATLAAVAEPDAAIVTTVAAAHLEGLGSIEGVLREKGALLEHLRPGGFAVLNADEELSFGSLAARVPAGRRVVTVGVRKRADRMATMPVCDFDRIAYHLNGRETVRLPLLGCHNLYNSLFALAVAIELGVDAERACLALRDFEGPPMRLAKRRAGDLVLIDDAYNANPGSMKAAIKTLAMLPVTGRRVLVLGDMLELGEHALRLHREIGQELSCGEFALVAAVGSMARQILEGARERGLDDDRLVAYADAEECAKALPSRLRSGDVVLIKGSRRVGLERVVKRLADAAAASCEAGGVADGT